MTLVDNSAFCGQHCPRQWTDDAVRWTACGRLKNHENSRRTLLCCARSWLYNFSTSENGYHSEGTSGDLGETPASLKGSPGPSGATLGGPRSWFRGGRENGQPDSQRVSWTGGRTYGVWFADCLSGSARR